MREGAFFAIYFNIFILQWNIAKKRVLSGLICAQMLSFIWSTLRFSTYVLQSHRDEEYEFPGERLARLIGE